MNYSDYRLTLDVHDIRSNKIVKVKRGDTSKRLCISLTENGKVYHITDACTAVFKGKKPDGEAISHMEKTDSPIYIENNTIFYEMTNNTTDDIGVVECEVSLISTEGKVLLSPTFSILVEDTPVHDDDVIDTSDEPSVLDELIAETAKLKEDVAGLKENAITTVDKELDETSTNPVENGVIASEIHRMDDRVGWLEQKANDFTVDDALSDTSNNPIANSVVAGEISRIEKDLYSKDTGLQYTLGVAKDAKDAAATAQQTANAAGEAGYYAKQYLDNEVVPRLKAVEEDVADLKENGVSITVDTQLGNSPNPIANSAVALAIGDLEDGITRIDGRVDDLNDRLDNFRPDGTGGGIIVDDALSTTSTNPVQNKVVTSKINSLVVEDDFTLKYESGAVVNNNGVAVFDKSTTVWEYVVLDVSKHTGATLGVKTYMNKGHIIFVADSEFNIKATYEPNTAYPNNTNLQTDISITIPDGATWVIIPHYVGKPDVEVTGYTVDKYIRRNELVQSRGDSETAIMSQKIVTEALNTHDEAITKMAYSFRKVDAVCDRYSNEVGEVGSPVDPVKDVYALYDGLVSAHPEYVSRMLIGTITPDMVQTPNTTAWQQSGKELPALTETLPIYRYDFKPPMVANSKTDDVSKILYCSGIHGGEMTPVLQGFRFFKDLCDNWRNQELLKDLRFNCHFTVIPLVNPYGIKFSRKTNEHGVNLNRNFTNGWRYVEDDHKDGDQASPYSGEAPASELATQLIEAMTKNERFDFGLDHHTFDNFIHTGEVETGIWTQRVGYFVGNGVARPQDRSFADLVGIWINAKTVSNNTLITDLSKSYMLNIISDSFGGYLFGAFPAGYCFETINGWGTESNGGPAMEAVYPSQKFCAEVLGGIFHTAMVSYHSY